MDIFTVRDNLKNTILGKEMLLDYVLQRKHNLKILEK